MPHKNPHCGECRLHPKMKHDHWLEFKRYAKRSYTRWGRSSYAYGEVWSRIVKCPDCGAEQLDYKTRKLKPNTESPSNSGQEEN